MRDLDGEGGGTYMSGSPEAGASRSKENDDKEKRV